MHAHGLQKRASGEAYFAHPLEVAAILTDLKLDDATIAAAVLHDTIEDTEATLEEINRSFGPQIGALVDGLTKIARLDLVSKRAAQGENFRKLLLAIAADVRVLLVKLADRLHNMRTLGFMPADKRQRIAEETLDIYAPLAGRMGIQEMRDELEDLAFRHLNPEAYETISRRLRDSAAKSERAVENIERELTKKLASKDVHAKVKGREKRPYSIWRKMERKSVAFEQLSDIFGFRIIVDTIDECYQALGVVHTTWPMVPGRYKDYISTPKQNDYRSIHTTVIGPGRQRVELQIRTREMDEVAEYGIAAHALYKDGGTDTSRLASESRAYQWLRRTVDLLAEGDNPEEFLEHTKLELFHDQVFCFTPKGRLIALPRGATPIDFAYAVHTDVGNTAVGCKINGRMAPLLTELAERRRGRDRPRRRPDAAGGMGIARRHRQGARRDPPRHALGGAATICRARPPDPRARLRARRQDAHGRQAQGRAAAAGTVIDRRRARRGRARRDVFRRRRQGGVSPTSRRSAAPPRPRRTRRGWLSLAKGGASRSSCRGRTSGGESGIPIRGLDVDLPVRFAPDGGAVPGDRIVGILTPGEGVTIYPIQSPALAAFDNEPERWLDVRWDIDPEAPQRFPARLELQSINEPGTLAQIAQVIADHDGNIDNVSMKRRTQDFTNMTDRPCGLGPEAPQRHHRRAAGEARHQPGRAGDRLNGEGGT